MLRCALIQAGRTQLLLINARGFISADTFDADFFGYSLKEAETMDPQLRLTTLVTFCMGFLQTLLMPMMLNLTNEEVLGVVRSSAAVGMVASSLAIGVLSLGHRHLTYISTALGAGGLLVFLIGSTVNVA